MKISAKTKDCRLVVKVKTSSHETIDEKELDRFARVYLRCFLKPTLVRRNLIEYTGPVAIPLKERLNKAISKRDFLFILEHIVVAVQKLNGNRFAICNLNMDMQQIYINETTKELQFLYVPLTTQQSSGNIIALFDSIIYLAQPAAEKDTEYISRFNYFFKSLKPFNIDKIEQFIYQEDRSVVNTIKKHNAGQSGFITSDHKHYYDHMDAQNKVQNTATNNVRSMPVQGNQPIDEDATSLLYEPSGSVRTYSNTAAPAKQPYPVSPVRYNMASAETSGLSTVDEEATGLLTDYGAAYGGVGSYNEAASIPSVDEEATGLLTDYGVTQAGFVDDHNGASIPSVDEEATGLLTDYGAAVVGNTADALPTEDAVTGLYIENDVEETTLLTENQVSASAEYPELFRVLTGETISINKPVFRIGKERSYVDYFVTNNSAVSRSHADIITRGTGFFVVDLNSKNKTYINNKVLSAQTETPIHDGDLLRLGNEEFIFRAVTKQSVAATLLCAGCKKPVVPGVNFCPCCGRKVQG